MRTDKQGHDELVNHRATPIGDGSSPLIMAWRPWAPHETWPQPAPSVRWQTLETGPGHAITVYLFALDAPLPARTALTDCLSAAEQARAERFRSPLHAQRHRIGRAVARHLLASWQGSSRALPAHVQTWVEGEHGKPALGHAAAPRFNLSHSGGWALLAVSDTLELGVDLEDLSGIDHLHDMAARILSQAELAEQAFAPSPQTLLSSWVRKEACLKALGVGLTQEMHNLSLHADAGQGQATLASHPEQIHWTDLGLPQDCTARACCAWLSPAHTIS